MYNNKKWILKASLDGKENSDAFLVGEEYSRIIMEENRFEDCELLKYIDKLTYKGFMKFFNTIAYVIIQFAKLYEGI